LPVVLCHRDFWIENIFYVDGKIILEMIRVKFGYRMVQEYLFVANDPARKASVERLQVLADLWQRGDGGQTGRNPRYCPPQRIML
jgi:hypothetical protein